MNFVFVEGFIVWFLSFFVEVVPFVSGAWAKLNSSLKFIIVFLLFMILPLGSSLLACVGIRVDAGVVCPADGQAYYDIIATSLALFAGSQVTHQFIGKPLNKRINGKG